MTVEARMMMPTFHAVKVSVSLLFVLLDEDEEDGKFCSEMESASDRLV